MAAAGLIIGATVGIGLSLWESNDANKAREKAIEAQRRGAKLKFSATQDSVNMMKAQNTENTITMAGEILRVGAAKSRETADAIQEVASTSIAQSEGLTSGRSKGRQLASLYSKGNKAMQKTSTETQSMLNQVIDTQDKNTNQLNNKLIGAHQELTAILSNEGVGIDPTIGAIGAGIQLGITGMQIESAFT